jgi:hypothetical protein
MFGYTLDYQYPLCLTEIVIFSVNFSDHSGLWWTQNCKEVQIFTPRLMDKQKLLFERLCIYYEVTIHDTPLIGMKVYHTYNLLLIERSTVLLIDHHLNWLWYTCLKALLTLNLLSSRIQRRLVKMMSSRLKSILKAYNEYIMKLKSNYRRHNKSTKLDMIGIVQRLIFKLVISYGCMWGKYWKGKERN